MRFGFFLALLLASACPRGGDTPSDGGLDGHVPPCDTEAAALVRRAALITEQIVRSDAYADCVWAEIISRYMPCEGDPNVNASNVERALRLQSAAMLSRDTFPVDACVPGALELPDTLPPLERAAFQELVAFTLLERSVRECEPHKTRLDDGCREPYPAPLARIAGRIAHLRVHRAGYSHGVDVESQNCRTGFVDHDGNGTLDDCARGGEPVVALDDADGDGVYDPEDHLETPMTRARFLCGIPDTDRRYYWPDESSAPGIAERCVQTLLLGAANSCVTSSPRTEGYLEAVCGEERVLLQTRFGEPSCACFPWEQDALGVFEVDTSPAITEAATRDRVAFVGPTTRVAGVANVIAHADELEPREELIVHDHTSLRVLEVAATGELREVASLPEAPDFPALRFLGTVRVGAEPRELVVARRALDDGWQQELMLLDAQDGFRVNASFRSGGSALDGVGLEPASLSVHTGDVSAADGEELVFQTGTKLVVLGTDTAPTVRFRVRAQRTGGLANQPYARTDSIVGLVDLDGDGRASILVRGEQHFNVLGLVGPVGAETISEEILLAYGDPWGTWMIAAEDEVGAILDVDGVPGDEIVLVRRSGPAATLAVLGVTAGDVSARRVLYSGSSAGAVAVNATLRIDAAGDFDGDGRGDLVVRTLVPSFTRIARSYLDLAVISGTATGAFSSSARWRVFQTRGSWTLRSDDFAAAAGRLRSGSRDAFVLTR